MTAARSATRATSVSAPEHRSAPQRGGATYLDLAVAGREAVHSMLLTARKYEWALNAALADFAQRTVRHPDFLIAVQEVWAALPNAKAPPPAPAAGARSP